MVATSAGILLHRSGAAGVEVLVAHMGGPFWAKKDEAAWSIPKGEYDPELEDPRAAARREFLEELGVEPPDTQTVELGAFAYASGKRLIVFAADGAGFPASGFEFGLFSLEWPPHSGRLQEFPEVDRVEWLPIDVARTKLVKGQRPVLDALLAHLGADS